MGNGGKYRLYTGKNAHLTDFNVSMCIDVIFYPYLYKLIWRNLCFSVFIWKENAEWLNLKLNKK